MPWCGVVWLRIAQQAVPLFNPLEGWLRCCFGLRSESVCSMVLQDTKFAVLLKAFFGWFGGGAPVAQLLPEVILFSPGRRGARTYQEKI